jgi:hypothetical protein
MFFACFENMVGTCHQKNVVNRQRRKPKPMQPTRNSSWWKRLTISFLSTCFWKHYGACHQKSAMSKQKNKTKIHATQLSLMRALNSPRAMKRIPRGGFELSRGMKKVPRGGIKLSLGNATLSSPWGRPKLPRGGSELSLGNVVLNSPLRRLKVP